jgi:hypothetical protein
MAVAVALDHPRVEIGVAGAAVTAAVVGAHVNRFDTVAVSPLVAVLSVGSSDTAKFPDQIRSMQAPCSMPKADPLPHCRRISPGYG